MQGLAFPLENTVRPGFPASSVEEKTAEQAQDIFMLPVLWKKDSPPHWANTLPQGSACVNLFLASVCDVAYRLSAYPNELTKVSFACVSSYKNINALGTGITLFQFCILMVG